MLTQNYTIQPMTRQQLDLAIEWAAVEGWNPGWHDADCFYSADPNGFLVGLLDGEPIASLSAVRYGTTFGFLGFYIVKPDYRGMGYGLQIWNAGLKYLQGRTVGLDGVVAQQPNYIKSGFQLAHRNIRYEGVGGGIDPALIQPEVIALSTLSPDAIVRYDRDFFPDDRTPFLQCWLKQPDSYGAAIVESDRVAGYGLARKCRAGYKFGPLFANTPQFACNIFLALVAKVESGIPFYLDVPEVNPTAINLAEQHRMKGIFETARMYINSQPELPWERTYGITTFELG